MNNHESRLTFDVSRFTFDVYLVGVGGQGVLTIGNLITEAAARQSVPVIFYPTKGMAQRGGAVKARLRLGREAVGPNIPEHGADLVIAMERSEALKAVRFIKPGGDFVLFGRVWAPAAVMAYNTDRSGRQHPSGKADYPTLEQVRGQVQEAGGRMQYLDPANLPLHEGAPVPANIFVLGAALGHTGLGEVLDSSEVARLVQNRWKKGAVRNSFAFQAGLEAEPR